MDDELSSSPQSNSQQSKWKVFLRLWLVLQFSYWALRLSFDVGIRGVVDLRPATFLEMLLIPFGQAIVFTVIARRGRSG